MQNTRRDIDRAVCFTDVSVDKFTEIKFKQIETEDFKSGLKWHMRQYSVINERIE